MYFLLCVCAKLLQLCPTLFDPMDCSQPFRTLQARPDSSVHGILQARTLAWVAMIPGDPPNPGIERVSLTSPALAGRFSTTSTTLEAHFLL